MARISVPVKDLAAALGVSRVQVYRLARHHGMPVHSIEAAVAWRAQRATRPAPDHDGEAMAGHWERKARRELAEADYAEMRVAERRGALIDAQAVRKSRLQTAAAVAAALRRLPQQLAPMAATQDPQRVAQLWAEAIDQVLAQLGDDLVDGD